MLRLLWLSCALLLASLAAPQAEEAEADITSGALAADDECLASDGSESACSLQLLSLRARKEKADSKWGSCAEYGCGGYVRGHSCQCNVKCGHYRNCCPDYAARCQAAGSRSVAVPSPTLKGARSSPGDAADGAVPGAGPLMEFYMYRGQNDNDFPLANVNAANLEGVMWYLHHEIVNQCPRRFGITRIMRLKMQVRATPELYNNGMSFGLRYAFDSGKCTSKHGFNATSDRYGFVVGCNNLGQTNQVAFPRYDPHYPGAIWYSLPGSCPGMEYPNKTDHCMKTQPGGKCTHPTGAWDCTWTYENAGQISVDELVGIDRTSFTCEKGCVEYREATDHGSCTSWWNGYSDVAKNRARVQMAHAMFKEKYPDMPADLPTPKCDFNNKNYWGRAPPVQHKFGD
mmetsp:Transcript_94704/g.192538  ORF Transcript_94704/g.192538 Transcript_94704/m.192538 type:complete len:400 (+) Transcript_94704:53-1252(+)